LVAAAAPVAAALAGSRAAVVRAVPAAVVPAASRARVVPAAAVPVVAVAAPAAVAPAVAAVPEVAVAADDALDALLAPMVEEAPRPAAQQPDALAYPPSAPAAAAQAVLSVNAALDALASLSGQEVAVNGILRFEPEGVALDHFPSTERRDAPIGAPRESSSIWLYLQSSWLQLNEGYLRKRRHGKPVIVRGTLSGPAFHGGCGLVSAWPAEIAAHAVDPQ